MYYLKRDLVVGIVIGTIVGLVLGFAVVHLVYTAATDQMSNLEGQVASLQTDMEDKDTEITNLQTEIQSKEAEISNLQLQINTKNSEISSLQGQVDDKDSTIDGLQSQITGLEQEISAKNTEISNLEQEIEDLESELLQAGQQEDVLGVYFSPNGGCEDEILYWINRANESIHILVYSFTLDSIGNALVEAHEKGIEVQVVFEEGQIGGVSQDDKLRTAGIAVRTDTNSRYMHNKVAIVDGAVVITGSYDWSQTAEIFNNENLVVMEGDYVSSVFEEEFSTIWDASRE